MSSFDDEYREDGKCGYIDDDRDTPCGLVEGWGFENTNSGFCRHHSNRGGQSDNQNAAGNDGGAPEGNQNATQHGAYRTQSTEFLHGDEQPAFDDAVEMLESPASAQELARTAAGTCLIRYNRSGDPRFLRRFESICDKFNIAPSDELDINHSGSVDFWQDSARTGDP